MNDPPVRDREPREVLTFSKGNLLYLSPLFEIAPPLYIPLTLTNLRT